MKVPKDTRPVDPWIEKPEAEQPNGATSEGSEIVSPDEQGAASFGLQTRRRIKFPGTARTSFGISAGWLLRHTARDLGYEVTPDGFVRVSDVVCP